MVRRCSVENSKRTAAMPGRNLYKLVAASFGFLCIVQVALNILVRLALYKNILHIGVSFKNLTEERDELKKELKRKQIDLNNIEVSFKNVTEERDELKRKLTAFGLCSSECVDFRGSSYYISSFLNSWKESRDDCLQRGADLVIINNHEEQVFTRRFKKRIWIGLTYKERERTWKWVDGTPLNKSYWAASEPNNEGDENCAEVKHYYSENSWNDELCNNRRFWICEKTLL